MSINTGIYRKVERNGKVENVLIEDHTAEELGDFLHYLIEHDDATGDDLAKWIMPIIEALKNSEAYRLELQQSIENFRKQF